MKELSQELLDELEQLALLGCQAIRAALTRPQRQSSHVSQSESWSTRGDEFHQRARGGRDPSGNGGHGCPTASAVAFGGPQERRLFCKTKGRASRRVMHGSISNVVLDKGFGFILGADGQSYFFHLSALQDGACLKTCAKAKL
jgi:hypothetical protein